MKMAVRYALVVRTPECSALVVPVSLLLSTDHDVRPFHTTRGPTLPTILRRPTPTHVVVQLSVQRRFSFSALRNRRCMRLRCG